MRKRTRVTHLPDVKVAPDNRPLVAPIYQSVKFSFDDVGETKKAWAGQRDGFYYSRVSNPTLRQLELVLAELQGRDAGLLTGSGVAAISMTLLALLQAGDHVLYFAETYQPTRALLRRLLAPLRRDEHDAFGHRPRLHRAHARRDPDETRRVRVADEPRPEDRRPGADHQPRARSRRAHVARQHARGSAQPRPVRRRPVRAQPDEVRLRSRRRDGRGRDRVARADRRDA